jgi:hypothetical protein
MRLLSAHWCPLCLGLIFVMLFLFAPEERKSLALIQGISRPYNEIDGWQPPLEQEIPYTREGDLIRYGRQLITQTAYYLGPSGIVAHKSNGMNCGNCHVLAGTQNFGNPFSAVRSSYPRFRDRSGKVESVAFRVNECMQRSLNGQPLDSTGEEMQAIVAYVRWVGKDVPEGIRPAGAGIQQLPVIEQGCRSRRRKQGLYTILHALSRTGRTGRKSRNRIHVSTVMGPAQLCCQRRPFSIVKAGGIHPEQYAIRNDVAESHSHR